MRSFIQIFILKLLTVISISNALQYLESSHPDHTRKSVVYSQALSSSWLCSFEEDFEGNKSNMSSWFLKPICSQCTLSVRPENIRKSCNFLICFQAVEKGCIGNKWVKEDTQRKSLIRKWLRISLIFLEKLNPGIRRKISLDIYILVLIALVKLYIPS